MAKTIALICIALSWTSRTNADGTGHNHNSAISTPTLNRGAKQSFGDPPPLPNPFFTDEAFNAPSSPFGSSGGSFGSSDGSFGSSNIFTNSDFGSSGSFSNSFSSDRGFSQGFSNLGSQPSVVSVNTFIDTPETFRTTGGQARAPLPSTGLPTIPAPGPGEVQGGIDFSQGERQPDGRLCVIKITEVDQVVKDPILECTHKNVEKCHYTYVTQFKPSQEEVCEENFEKKCQITFKKQATTEIVKKCYTPIEKVCNGQGPEECRTVYESSCSTKYIEKQPGKFVGDTKCEKLPVEICGAGCVTEEQPEECHDKEVVGIVEVPEEVCDLNPQKTCRFTTKLVPSLSPKHECTIIPKETCHLKFDQPRIEKKPLRSEWCLDESEPIPDETYDDSDALGLPINPRDGRSEKRSIRFIRRA